MLSFGVEEINIYKDIASGKDFERPYYNLLVGTESSASLLREGDLLVISALDRLGRNYAEIYEQWNKITNVIKADIKVLDMPLLDTTQSTGALEGKLVSGIVLQFLAYCAEKERANILERQRAGYDALKKDDKGRYISNRTGNPVGRPAKKLPKNFDSILAEWAAGNISGHKAAKLCNLSTSSYLRIAREKTETEV